MEIKINKEIRNRQENVFFGLSVRQLIYSGLALGLAVGVYFALRDHLGGGAASWLCMLCAAPVAVAGFFRYNGMTFGQFVWAMVKTLFLCGRPRSFRAENLYEKVLRSREGRKHV